MSDKIAQLKGQYEEKLKEREAAYQANIEEIMVNKDEGVCNTLFVRLSETHLLDIVA